MPKLGEAWVELRADDKKLKADFQQAEGKVRGLASALSTAAIIFAGRQALVAAEQQALAESRLQGVLTATGHAAGFTAGQLKKMAAELQKVTRFGDETTLAAQAILATFRNVNGEAFTRTIELAMDLSEVLGTDLRSATIQLGKALNDPIVGLTALQRSGITFSEAQKDMIRGMVESGQLMEAQGVILEELDRQFGGVAKTVGGTWVGALSQGKNALGDLMEDFGRGLGFMAFAAKEFGKDTAKAFDTAGDRSFRDVFADVVHGIDANERKWLDEQTAANEASVKAKAERLAAAAAEASVEQLRLTTLQKINAIEQESRSKRGQIGEDKFDTERLKLMDKAGKDALALAAALEKAGGAIDDTLVAAFERAGEEQKKFYNASLADIATREAKEIADGIKEIDEAYKALLPTFEQVTSEAASVFDGAATAEEKLADMVRKSEIASLRAAGKTGEARERAAKNAFDAEMKQIDELEAALAEAMGVDVAEHIANKARDAAADALDEVTKKIARDEKKTGTRLGGLFEFTRAALGKGGPKADPKADKAAEDAATTATNTGKDGPIVKKLGDIAEKVGAWQ